MFDLHMHWLTNAGVFWSI